jgi:hypothetical protein
VAWGRKGFDGELWLRKLRAEDTTCLVKNGSQRHINADVKQAARVDGRTVQQLMAFCTTPAQMALVS